MQNWEDVNTSNQHALTEAKAMQKTKYSTFDATKSLKRYWSNAKLAKMAKVPYRNTSVTEWLVPWKDAPANYTHYFRLKTKVASNVNEDIYLGTWEYCYYLRFRG